MSDKPLAAAIDGWHTMSDKPHLIGSQCTQCETYFFPPQYQYCRNPGCDSTDFQEVELSRTGHIWSYTNACYQPPEPFVAADPFEPYALAAVQLEKEQMVVLGQVIEGVKVTDIHVKDGQVTGVSWARDGADEQGTIESDIVVNCGGMWGHELGRMLNTNVPLQACEHFYIVTEAIAGLSQLPVLRVPDECAYYKIRAI